MDGRLQRQRRLGAAAAGPLRARLGLCCESSARRLGFAIRTLERQTLRYEADAPVAGHHLRCWSASSVTAEAALDTAARGDAAGALALLADAASTDEPIAARAGRARHGAACQRPPGRGADRPANGGRPRRHGASNPAEPGSGRTEGRRSGACAAADGRAGTSSARLGRAAAATRGGLARARADRKTPNWPTAVCWRSIPRASQRCSGWPAC